MKQDSFDGGDLSAMSSASRDGYSPRGAGHWQGGPWMSSGEPSPYIVTYSAHGMSSVTLKLPCNERSLYTECTDSLCQGEGNITSISSTRFMNTLIDQP